MSGIFRIELPLNRAFKAGTMEPWKAALINRNVRQMMTSPLYLLFQILLRFISIALHRLL